MNSGLIGFDCLEENLFTFLKRSKANWFRDFISSVVYYLSSLLLYKERSISFFELNEYPMN
jgi:hypothetical protein